MKTKARETGIDKIEVLAPFTLEDQDIAQQYMAEIMQRKKETAMNLIELGRLFKKVRDKLLYKLLHHDTFESFLADPDIAFGRSTVFSFINIYELYVEKLSISPDLLALIGHRRLRKIKGVVEQDPTEWLYKARELSASDLENEVRVNEGKEEKIFKSRRNTPESIRIEDFDSYSEYVLANPCIICRDKEVERAHLPKTKGSGAPDEWIVPLCHKCHIEEYHPDPIKFLVTYRNLIFGYFYNTFIKCFNKELT